MKPPKIIIGIDPGTKTGFAYKDLRSQEYHAIETLGVLDALDFARDLIAEYGKENVYLVFEDARQRKWFGDAGKEKLQGVGSVKRDCSIWQEFCEKTGINWLAQKPKAGTTKYSPAYFKRITGWQKRTSEHARDAAILIHGYSAVNIKLHFAATQCV